MGNIKKERKMTGWFSSKPKVVEKSGFMGDTSEEQDKCL